MMPIAYGNTMGGILPSQPQDTMYQTDVFYEDLSRQLAAASASSNVRRRHSKGSMSRPGAPMRIAKPSSANNSPRSSSFMQSRRRSFLYQRKSPQVLPSNNYLATPELAIQQQQQQQQQQYAVRHRNLDAAVRPARPVSWHPGTYLMSGQAPLSLVTQFAVPTYAMAAGVPTTCETEPFPAMPSSYALSPASPSVTFSPCQGTFDGYSNYYCSPNPWGAVSPAVDANGVMFDKLPSPVDCPALIAEQQCQTVHIQQQQPQQLQQQPQQQQIYHHHHQQTEAPQQITSANEWSTLPAHGMAPSTPPDSFTSGESTQTRIPAETNIAYESLTEDEPEGEILIGMGLYDPPEKDIMFPTMKNYQATVSHLLGSFEIPEPTGKGLKLEDSWEPPENMDDDDEERDAEGEEQ